MNPTTEELEKIAEELAFLGAPDWFNGKEVHAVFNDDNRIWRVESTDGRACLDVCLDDVRNVWLERQTPIDQLAARVDKLEERVRKLEEPITVQLTFPTEELSK